jgi:hypothetical protein
MPKAHTLESIDLIKLRREHGFKKITASRYRRKAIRTQRARRMATFRVQPMLIIELQPSVIEQLPPIPSGIVYVPNDLVKLRKTTYPIYLSKKEAYNNHQEDLKDTSDIYEDIFVPIDLYRATLLDD